MHGHLRRNMRNILPALLLLFFLFLDGVSPENTYAQAPDGASLFQPCAACHSIGKGKLVGPDLSKVTERRDKEWLHKFIKNSQAVVQSGDDYAVKLFEAYNKIPMPPFAYSDEQIDAVLNYIGSFNAGQPAAVTPSGAEAAAGQKPEKVDFFPEVADHSRQYGTTFLIAILLLVIAAIDLFITKLIRMRFVHIMIMIISTFIIAETTIVESINLGRQPGYSPDQPILFSHKIHAGDNRIDCKYCHITVTRSRHAGIPPVQLCMNCHTAVRAGRYSGTAEIGKIYKALDSGMPVKWVKVHNLPDHTYFSHALHVVAGKVECSACHGDVTKTDRIKQMQELSMGWCIGCHRKTRVQFADNGYYRKFGRLRDELDAGTRDSVTVEDVGGTECARCHY